MSDISLTPPRGDFEKAEKYVNQLAQLITQNRIEVYHTDLKKFEPTTLKDHYSVSLKDYQIEISHSKNPHNDKDSHVMIFNNLKNLADGSGDKVILAYIYLADSQFSKFKIAADRQIYERERAEEEKKFNQAVEPIDELLDKASGHELSAPSHSNMAMNPLMQSFKQDFKEQLSSSLDSQEKPSEDYSPSQIHQA